MGKSIKKLRHKLKPSHLASQKELLSHDLDLSQIAFITRKLPTLRFDQAVIDGEVTRTIEGASTVRIKVNDSNGRIRKSGRLAQAVDIKIDGLWFRLVKVAKTGDEIDLTFECREVAVLRTYNARRVIGWGKMRRARFAQIIATEPKEFKIDFVCPDLMTKKKPKPLKQSKDPEEAAVNRNPGFGFWVVVPQDRPETGGGRAANLRIQNAPATRTQLENITAVLNQGVAMMLPRDFLQMAIMTGTVEAHCYNNPWGDVYDRYDSLEMRKKGSVGFFQQQPGWGSFENRMNLTKSSKKFYEEAVKAKRANPKMSLGELCQKVQVSAYPDRYAKWTEEANTTLTQWGYPPRTGPEQAASMEAASVAAAAGMTAPYETGIDEFQFMRGRPKTRAGGKKGWEKEDSWTCLVRLADEVDWRCFEVGGKIYFTTETHLFKSAPRMKISENSVGVDWIDFDYDIGKRNAQVNIQCRLNKWSAPPGSIVEIFGMGPVNGRWIVSEIRRNFFDTHAEITCKKPRARLPEPKKEDLTAISDVEHPEADPDTYVSTPGYTQREGTSLKNSLGSGANGIADALFDIALKAGGSGVYVGSDLRAPKKLSGGSYSDHSENNEFRAARDIGVKGIDLLVGPPSPKLDKGCVAIGDALGKNWKLKQTIDAINVDFHGFTIQVIWRTPKYGGHMGHIHVGVRDKRIAANRLSTSYSTNFKPRGASPTGRGPAET